MLKFYSVGATNIYFKRHIYSTFQFQSHVKCLWMFSLNTNFLQIGQYVWQFYTRNSTPQSLPTVLVYYVTFQLSTAVVPQWCIITQFHIVEKHPVRWAVSDRNECKCCVRERTCGSHFAAVSKCIVNVFLAVFWAVDTQGCLIKADQSSQAWNVSVTTVIPIIFRCELHVMLDW